MKHTTISQFDTIKHYLSHQAVDLSDELETIETIINIFKNKQFNIYIVKSAISYPGFTYESYLDEYQDVSVGSLFNGDKLTEKEFEALKQLWK